MSRVLPPGKERTARHTTPPVHGNGLNPTFDCLVHCLAEQPMETVLRVVVEDELPGAEQRVVAYETVVLGALRPGYRVLHLRSPLGTRIDGCVLAVHIAIGTSATPRASAEPSPAEQGRVHEHVVVIRL